MSAAALPSDDDTFLDCLLDDAINACAEGRVLDLDTVLRGREHLRSRAAAVLQTARQLAPVTGLDLLPRAPQQIAGYTILGEAGRGGMGIVYRARQESLGREVALKVLAPSLAISQRARARFETEARALARLRHPHVVAVYDVVASADVCAYAMEWLDGSTLAAAVQAGGALSVERALSLGLALANALEAVHAQGLVHRDIKPSNVLLRADGAPVLSDFGLVRDSEESMHTATGEFLGTMAYAAPEQLRGRHAEVGPCTDVYALGATLHAALTGAPPFEAASTAAMIRRVETGARTPLRRLNPKVSRDLAVVLDTAMDPQPGRRYATAQAFADDLRRVRDCEPIVARPIGRAMRVVLWSRRNPLVASVVVVLLTALGVTLWQVQVAATARAEAERNLDRAQRAIARLVDVARDELREAPGMSAHREAMLRSALDFYHELSGEHPADARTQLGWAAARAQAGMLHKELGELGRAADELKAAAQVLESAAQVGTLPVDLLLATARAWTALAGVEFAQGQADAARVTAVRAVAAHGRLVTVAPGLWHEAVELALFRASVAFHAGRGDEFDAALGDAQRVLDSLPPAEPRVVALRAQMLYRRSAALSRKRDLLAARSSLELALRDFRAGVAVAPQARSARAYLADALLKHAELASALSDRAAAAASLAEAEACHAALLRDFPGVAEYRDAQDAARELGARMQTATSAPAPAEAAPPSLREQLKQLLDVAQTARRRGEPAAAQAALRELFAKFDPAAATSWRDVGALLGEVPYALRDAADRRELLELITGWHTALGHLGAAPASTAQRFGEFWLLRAITALARSDAADAVAAVTNAKPLLPASLRREGELVEVEALTMAEPARGLAAARALEVAATPGDKVAGASAWWGASRLRLLGAAHLALGERDAAAQAWQEALDEFADARQKSPDDLSLRAEWARVVVELAIVAQAQQRVAAATLAEALTALQGLRVEGPRSPSTRHIKHALARLADLVPTALDDAARALREDLLAPPK